jgi:hypothetical protein
MITLVITETQSTSQLGENEIVLKMNMEGAINASNRGKGPAIHLSGRGVVVKNAEFTSG